MFVTMIMGTNKMKKLAVRRQRMLRPNAFTANNTYYYLENGNEDIF